MEHTVIAIIHQRGRRQSRSLGESGATLEHAKIATPRQRSSRQSRSLGESGALIKHASIATLRQRGSRQIGSLGKTGATVEHASITTFCQCRSRQSRSLDETSAILEHEFVTTLRHRRMLSGLNSCIIKKILDIADTCNISTSKDPFIKLSWDIGTETSNLHIPSTSKIQDIIASTCSRRQSSRTIPSRPGRGIRRILQSTIPVFGYIVHFQSKAAR